MVMPAPAVGAAVGFAALAAVLARSIKKVLDTPSRPYNGSFEGVGKEYDEWTNEGILEKFWGEHIHLGYYTEEERASGWWKANFKQAKYVFVDKMMEWGDADNLENAERILDVGCGFGGSSRILAKKYPDAKVTGITLSREQVRRGTELAVEQDLANVEFKAMDALHMDYEDNTFDLVWACESGEHMPDKQKYIEEMTRVLKPGGKLIVACWCQRESPPKFSEEERSRLQFLYDEWSHPFFISIEQFARFMKGTGSLEKIGTDNWVQQTIASWRHSILVGVINPWPVVFSSPVVWWKVIREIVCLERMHRAFRDGLMTYGMIKAVKKIQN
ncbi:hypothetical protein NDN08_008164 [Rhodosorus marinus]|uniref:Methyltransferase domain-containing protein n=1 Tax=Rhodosorus marinus TaxID=101924 RepID=A0AAV8V3W4_9RHOD|nr:hypothetical protein NDN08_008164 [Rhodosorus marinus]